MRNLLPLILILATLGDFASLVAQDEKSSKSDTNTEVFLEKLRAYYLKQAASFRFAHDKDGGLLITSHAASSRSRSFLPERTFAARRTALG